MKFHIWIACRDDCENYETAREVIVLDDAVDAIKKAEMLRDLTHESWIVINENDTTNMEMNK